MQRHHLREEEDEEAATVLIITHSREATLQADHHGGFNFMPPPPPESQWSREIAYDEEAVDRNVAVTPAESLISLATSAAFSTPPAPPPSVLIEDQNHLYHQQY